MSLEIRASLKKNPFCATSRLGPTIPRPKLAYRRYRPRHEKKKKLKKDIYEIPTLSLTPTPNILRNFTPSPTLAPSILRNPTLTPSDNDSTTLHLTPAVKTDSIRIFRCVTFV
ncbi:hypothetical protein E2C01_062550 [Portunus trituberculatus]|uniref:Uncharacterized protein n=1 Tax=Portunus trituberculatus TaxID=210409 RepID=A0A5B7H863_PORTR|nr:hypothetical protein [Portunus trituberculatus]